MNTNFASYSTIRPLGQGGMATVWLAEHNTLHQPVAIKVLNNEFLHNENIRKRFLAEARNMFKMSHPNIIKVTDLIDDGETVAFVMEYMEGQTLKEYLDKKGKLPDEEIKQLFTQMLDAVGYVHEQGLIHRDIKPSNFMISDKGVVKLLDFGIAKNTDASSAEYTMTGTAQNMGTPMYMSPEQVKSTKNVTAQSDIYSLGVVLWQMVIGRKPYDTSTISTFELQTRIVQEPLPLTNKHWDGIIQSATEKNCLKRYQFINEIINDLTIKSKEKVHIDKNSIEEKTLLEEIKINKPIKMVNYDKSTISSHEGLIENKKTNTSKPLLIKIAIGIVAVILILIFIITRNTNTQNYIQPVENEFNVSNNTNNSIEFPDSSYNYKTYYNEDRKFKIDYPDFLTMGSPSQNNDGREFITNGGEIRMFVFSSYYTEDEGSITNLYKEDLKNEDYSISYKRPLKNEWYVVSGTIISNGKLFYKKVYFSNKYGSQIRTMLIEYPRDKVKMFDTIIPKLLKSFTDY